MTLSFLAAQIRQKQSLLCVGLDADPTRLPAGVASVLAFNQAIIEATLPYAIAYKINTAFYEAHGAEGWRLLEQTRDLLPADVMVIMDAKRGDIGNTASQYAQAFFGHLRADALTVSPYMGLDTLEPYLAYPNALLFVLAATSNLGAAHFEHQLLANGRRLFEDVVHQCEASAGKSRYHYVAGATRPHDLEAVRALAPDALLLVPGVGAQGGVLAQVCKAGLNAWGGLLINASRSILYASAGQDFASKAAQEARHLQAEMSVMLKSKGII